MKNPRTYLFTILAIVVLVSTVSCNRAAATPTPIIKPTDTPPPPTTTPWPTYTPLPTPHYPTRTPLPSSPTPTPAPTITPIPPNIKLGIDIPVRIMPMGDSITEGVCDSAENCNAPGMYTPISGDGYGLNACSWNLNQVNPKVVSYRASLREKLLDIGLKFTYVGSISVTEGLAHEGHSAFTISDLDFCVQNAGWLQEAQPNMILLHIGTNDAGWDHTPDKIAADLSQLLEHIYDQLPETTYVIVAQVIPLNSELREGFVKLSTLGNELLAQYNAKIPAVVDQFHKEGKNVFYVDMWGAVQSDSDLYDGVHPIPAALERMADIWFNKIVEILTRKP